MPAELDEISRRIMQLEIERKRSRNDAASAERLADLEELRAQSPLGCNEGPMGK